MFQFLLSAYRRLAAAVEETASIREALNAELRAAVEDRGIEAEAPRLNGKRATAIK